MKVFLFIVLMCLFSALLVARDLGEVAKKERLRRQAGAARKGKTVPIYTNTDLERFHRNAPPPETRFRNKSSPPPSRRDYEKERKHWRKEKEQHQREVARIDARIRRLEWRLADRRARRRPGERLREDPAEKALEDSLESMRAERKRFIEEFLERGRKAGAFPGWLR